MRPKERAVEGKHGIALRRNHNSASTLHLDYLVVSHQAQSPLKVTIGLEGILQEVLFSEKTGQKCRLRMDASEGNSFLQTQLVAKGRERACHEGLREKSVSQSIAVVGEHQDLLELVSCADGKLENIFLRLCGDSRKVADRVPDCSS